MAGADLIAQQDLAELERLGLRRAVETLDGAPGPVVQLDGRELINLCSNDYLGLAASRALASAVAGETTGAGASRLVCGSLRAHARLETLTAAFERTDAAVLFNSGYCANLGAIQALVGREDAIFCDALNHASLVDGARLSRAEVHVYPHLDLEALERALAQSKARRKLIATDAVFSMDGDLAPLPALCDLAERFGAMLLVDEAHATGVFGANGGGLAEHLGCAPRIDVRVGTFSKAAGSFGGFAAGSRTVCDLIINRARSFIFTTALPPTVCAASADALFAMGTREARARLWHNIERFAVGLRELGLPAEPRSPIFPIVLGAPERAIAVAQALRERGVLAKAIRPPTVPEGTSRLRLSLSAAHSDEHLDHAIDALAGALGHQR